MTFKEWMTRVDDALLNAVGVCSSDLIDFAYRDAYDDGCSPNDTAWDVLQDNGIGEF